MANKPNQYYVPDQSPWPVITAVSLLILAYGAATFIQQNAGAGITNNTGHDGKYILPIGILCVISMMFLWFRDTIRESLKHMNSTQMDV